MTPKISVGQKVIIESKRDKPAYAAVVLRTEGAMVLVRAESGETKLVPLRDVIPSE